MLLPSSRSIDFLYKFVVVTASLGWLGRYLVHSSYTFCWLLLSSRSMGFYILTPTSLFIICLFSRHLLEVVFIQTSVLKDKNMKGIVSRCKDFVVRERDETPQQHDVVQYLLAQNALEIRDGPLAVLDVWQCSLEMTPEFTSVGETMMDLLLRLWRGIISSKKGGILNKILNM